MRVPTNSYAEMVVEFEQRNVVLSNEITSMQELIAKNTSAIADLETIATWDESAG